MKEVMEIAEGFEVGQALSDHAADPSPDTAVLLVEAVLRTVAQTQTVRNRVFPQGKNVGRCGDMAPHGRSHMTVQMDSDSDACVAIWDHETGEHGSLATIEFCTSLAGGKSPRTRDALVALMAAMAAMEADNASSPRGRWPPEPKQTPEPAPALGAISPETDAP